MKTSMANTLFALTTCISLACGTAKAGDYQAPNQLDDGHFVGKYEQERVGTGLGMFIGAVAGGPIGMVVAGFVGNKIGESQGEGEELVYLQDEMGRTQEQLAKVKAEHAQQLQLANQRLEAMQQQYVQRQLQYEKQMAAMHNASMADKALAVSLQFRTGSSELEPQYKTQLIEMAKVMKDMRQYSLDLSGYADRQGEEKFNQVLSQQRADAVKAFLVSQGIDAKRITTKGYGESQPLQAKQTTQSDFFDRRVLMKLNPTNQAVAKN